VGLLAPPEQQLFRRLAVVAGSASLSLVQRLGGETHDATAVDPWAVVDALDQLVQRSLVEVVSVDSQGPPRYRLLESPRALALELLAASGEEDELRLRHARGVLAEYDAAQAALHAGTLGLQDGMRLAEAELDNARDAIAWLRQTDLPALELALTSAMMTPALNAERLALADRCQQLIERGTPAAQPLDPVAVCRAWRQISIALANLAPQRSVAAASSALALARELDASQADRHLLYDALCGAAHMLVEVDGANQAEQLLREARAIEDPSWPPVRRRSALRVQASIAAARGHSLEALQLYRRLLEVNRAAGDAGLVTLLNLANAELAAGDAEAAVASGARLIGQLLAGRDEIRLRHASINLAAAQLMLGRTADARQTFQATWPLLSRGPMLAWCLDHLALLAALEGRHDAAAQLVGAASARYEATADQREVNERRAHARTLDLLRVVRTDAALATLLAQGRALSDAELATLSLEPA
jgi:hypothetical protein